MGDIKFTLGDVSKNQTFSASKTKTDFDKNLLGNNKIQQSIFSKFDSKQVNGKIDQGLEQMLMFKKLSDAAALDGNATNLSEDEALAFLAEQGIEDATAQDLFDFLNIAQGNKKVKDEPVQQPQAEQVKPQEPQKQDVKLQEPEPQKVDSQQTQPQKPVKPTNFRNTTLDILNQNQQNLFFDRSIRDRAGMDLSTGDRKIGMYSRTLTDVSKGNSYSLDAAQTLIRPTGDRSLSVGAHTTVNKAGTFSGVAASGQVRTGNHSMLSGTVAYTAETGDNTSGFLNAKISEQVKFPEAAGLTINTSATFQDYKDPEIKMNNAGLSVKASLPIPGKKDSKVLHGGAAYLSGEVSHSSTTFTGQEGIQQGSTTLGKGTLGAAYNFGIPYVSDYIGDVTLVAQVSAFNMSDTDNGTQIAGGAYGPAGLNANFGKIPGYSGWLITGLEFNNIEFVNTDKTVVRASASYNTNLGGILKDVTPERSASVGASAQLKQSGLTFGAQYKSQITVDTKDRDVQAFIAKPFNLGNNTQVRLTAAGGYNTQTGGYGQVGVSMNIGNRHGRR